MKLNSLKYFLFLIILTQKPLFALDTNNVYVHKKRLLNNLKKAKTLKDSAYAYANFIAFFSNSNLDSSKYYYNKVIALKCIATYPKLEAQVYEKLADSYWYSNDFASAMNFYLKELRIGDSLNDKKIIASCKYNLGWIKTIQLKQLQYVNYFYEALQLHLSQKDTNNTIILYQALGSYYKDNKSKIIHAKDSCLKYFLKTIYILNNSTYKNHVTSCYANTGEFYLDEKEYLKAIEYSLIGITLAKKNNDEYNYVFGSSVLAASYLELDSIAQSKKVLISIQNFLSNPVYEPVRLFVYSTYLNIYKKEKNFEKAFDYSVKYKNLSDSINEKTFNQNLLQKENDYKLEKKDKAFNELQLKNQLQTVKNKNNSYIILGLAIFGFLILIILYFLFKSNKQKQQTNALLSNQNKIISEKKLEIEQSIHYAKGIQNAILPAITDLKKQLPHSFIFYLPKDVVSGDFYWLHQTSATTLLLAAADCTGHGVPGSLMSIVSMDKLNHAIFEKKLTQPNQILHSINNDIKNALKQDVTNAKQKDGLDIALLQINLTTNQLLYSGANRPLWIIRTSSESATSELIEYKPTKCCIAGHTELNTQYQQHEVLVQKNDFIIIFSDGYADQFGGNSGKKMMTKNFKELLISNCNKPITEIEQAISQNFTNWKNNYEQVDDVLVIGFKIC